MYEFPSERRERGQDFNPGELLGDKQRGKSQEPSTATETRSTLFSLIEG